ncbi:serine hydrolase [Marinicauda salina]|uniref:Serine hydrolase n=1 Tax=Marinicauda salina TaxID=2135793 RepID=A0A2U2BRZ0_9PROT|nr:serine hydrolase domain-containing protein [Marinicauda salina]PWE16780.1 serine hydrolase [Marinicauda salina]
MFLTILASISVAGAPASSADPRAELEAALPGWLAAYDVPGAAVAYIEDGDIVWTLTAGERSQGAPVGPDTVWNVASLTKPVTAEVVLRLAAGGDIDLDRAMADHYVDPDLAGDPHLEALTPRIALVHQTGFANWRSQTGGTLSFQSAPGTATGYSGEGYTYLGRFAEAAMHTPFPELADQTVLTPLGMDDSSYTPRAEDASRLAHPHDEAGDRLDPTPMPGWSGADNLTTTLEDYAGFVTAVMTGEGLSDELFEQRFAIAQNVIEDGCPLPDAHCPTAVGFGLGWEIFEYPGHRVVQHGGADAGERALAWFDEASGTGAVILTNGANGGKVIARVTEVLYPSNAAYHALLRMQAGMEATAASEQD